MLNRNVFRIPSCVGLDRLLFSIIDLSSVRLFFVSLILTYSIPLVVSVFLYVMTGHPDSAALAIHILQSHLE